jgi:hypothetical protein
MADDLRTLAAEALRAACPDDAECQAPSTSCSVSPQPAPTATPACQESEGGPAVPEATEETPDA